MASVSFSFSRVVLAVSAPTNTSFTAREHEGKTSDSDECMARRAAKASWRETVAAAVSEDPEVVVSVVGGKVNTHLFVPAASRAFANRRTCTRMVSLSSKSANTSGWLPATKNGREKTDRGNKSKETTPQSSPRKLEETEATAFVSTTLYFRTRSPESKQAAQ